MYIGKLELAMFRYRHPNSWNGKSKITIEKDFVIVLSPTIIAIKGKAKTIMKKTRYTKLKRLQRCGFKNTKEYKDFLNSKNIKMNKEIYEELDLDWRIENGFEEPTEED